MVAEDQSEARQTQGWGRPDLVIKAEICWEWNTNLQIKIYTTPAKMFLQTFWQTWIECLNWNVSGTVFVKTKYCKNLTASQNSEIVFVY